MASATILIVDDEDLTLRGTTAVTAQFRLPPEGVNVEEVERQLLVQALERTQENQTHAAQLLGLNRDQFDTGSRSAVFTPRKSPPIKTWASLSAASSPDPT
jgi:transcriptional regulator with AAA-type ATPase domain